MNIIMLVEDAHKPVPDNINVVQNFGYERLMIEPNRSVAGEAVLMSGSADAFKAWLMPFDAIWVTNNPMLGNWEVKHVKGENIWLG